MKTKVSVREDVWQHDQEERVDKLLCVGKSQSESQRHSSVFHSWSSPVRAASMPFCQNLSRAQLQYQFYFSLEIQPKKRVGQLWS